MHFIRESNIPDTDQLGIEEIRELLDSGRFAQAYGRLRGLEGTDDTSVHLLRAEIEIYYGRLDIASTILDGLTLGLSGRSLVRLGLVRGQLHYFRSEFERAEQDIQLAFRVAQFLDDKFQIANALFQLARLRRRQSRYQEVLPLLEEARSIVSKEFLGVKFRPDFLKGLIELNEAICRHQLGDLELAGSSYELAVSLLANSEGSRYYGLALNSYGAYLKRLGQYELAVSCLRSAIDIFVSLGNLDGIASGSANLGLTMIRLGRLVEAEELVTEALELHQRTGFIAGASICLQLLTMIALERSDYAAADRYSREGLEQALLSHDRFEEAYAWIWRAIVCLRGSANAKSDSRDTVGAPQQAMTWLERALHMGDEIGSRELTAVATLYLAEAYLGVSVVEGRELLKKAGVLVRGYGDVHYLSELGRIEQRYQGDRMVVTNDNRLSISGNFLPRIRDATAEVQRFLIKNALDQAGQNQSEAGRLLGVSKAYIHQKRKQFGI